VQNVAQPSKKAQLLIIGLQMESSIAYPAVNPSTVSSSQLQPMRLFTWALAIRSPAKNLKIYLIKPGFPGFLIEIRQIFR
jgi:hypothetical protein